MRSLTVTPVPAFNKMVAANVLQPMSSVHSGEITASVAGKPLGAVRTGCKVSKVWTSVLASGKDDSHTLSYTVDVKINGTTCMTTTPVIAHVSGEASTQKTTVVTGDTGITAGVVDATANTCAPGDVITYDFSLTRTASPTTEMANAVVVVELEPNK